MAEKSAKGQKIGRNSRAPSAKLQKSRTDRNKRLRIEKAVKAHGAAACTTPVFPRPAFHRPVERVTFSQLVRQNLAGLPLHLYYSSGVLCDVSPTSIPFSAHNPEHRILNPVSGSLRLVSPERENP
jgi:hypothetical protein